MPNITERIHAFITLYAAHGVTADSLSGETGIPVPSVRRSLARLADSDLVKRQRINGSYYYRPARYIY